MKRNVLLTLFLLTFSFVVHAQQDYSTLVTQGDASLITWTTSSDYPFIIDGNNVAYSSNAGVGNSESWLEGSITVTEPYQVTFDYSASTGAVKINMFMWSTDPVTILVDGEQVLYIGDVRNDVMTLNFDRGTHTFKIAYTKDESGDAMQDRAGISNVRIAPRVSDFASLSPDGSVTDFSTNDDTPWYCFEGRAESGNKGVDNSTSSFNINLNPDTERGLVFDWEVAAETNDKLAVYIDGDEDAALIAGGGESGKFSHNFAAGSHQVKLVYTKDAAISEGDDKAYVSNVRLLDMPYTQVVKRMLCVAHTEFSDSLEVSIGADYTHQHYAIFTFCNDGEVLIDSLMTFNSQYKLRTLRATAADGQIVMNVPSSKDNPYVLADHNNPDYPDTKFWTILTSGEMSQGYFYPSNDPLVFEINADTTVIRPSACLVAQDAYEFGTQYVMNAYNDAIYFIPMGKSLIETVDEVTLPTAHVGGTKQVELALTNYGDADGIVTADNSNCPELTVESPFTVEQLGGRKTVTVIFTPQTEGTYEKALTLTTADGWSKEVIFKGTVLGPLNYADIVVEGAEYITFNSAEPYSWDVQNNVAFSTNKGVANSSSILDMTVNIPDDCIATLTADMHYSCASGDSAIIKLNGEKLIGLSTMFWSPNGDYQLNQQLLGGANNTYSFIFRKDGSGDNGEDQVTLSNVVLKVVKSQENAATIDTETIIFENVSTGELKSIPVTFTNMGTNDFSVTGIDGDGIFNGVVPTENVPTFGTLPVNITCQSERDGHFEGDVTIHTTAGDFIVHCIADPENVLYLGDGPFPFSNYQGAYQGTYPFDPAEFGFDETTTTLYKDERLASLKDCKIVSITYHLLDNYYLTETEWADMNTKWAIGSSTLDEFPETTADLAIDNLTEVYNGNVIQFANKDLTVEFNEPYLWDGSDKLVVRFNSYGGQQSSFIYICGGYTDYNASAYESTSGKSRIEKMIPYIKIRYELPEPDDTGVNEMTVAANAELQSVKYYDISGIAHTTPVQGFNIMVKQYKDGRIESIKFYQR